MKLCRVCGTALSAPAYETPAPALTSVMTPADIPAQAFICAACGHAQSPDLPDVAAFYDSGYRISLASDDHDQIVRVSAEGVPLYRTDLQAEVSLRLLDLPQGAKLLDYGAAKADTLRKVVRARGDLHPHVFDVSTDYAAAWQGWVAVEDQATYETPAHWQGRFQAAMSHFALEHVAEPRRFLDTLHGLVAEGGKLLVTVPDPVINVCDMIVADHLNHFTVPSLKRAFADAGFRIESIDAETFPGAFFVLATRCAGPQDPALAPDEVAKACAEATAICTFWQAARAHVDAAAQRLKGRRAAIYGAGFYGSWLLGRIGDLVDVTLFLDQNPHLAGRPHLGRPVLLPAEMPADVDLVFVGLNPLRARDIIASVPALQRPGLEFVWLD